MNQWFRGNLNTFNTAFTVKTKLKIKQRSWFFATTAGKTLRAQVARSLDSPRLKLSLTKLKTLISYKWPLHPDTLFHRCLHSILTWTSVVMLFSNLRWRTGIISEDYRPIRNKHETPEVTSLSNNPVYSLRFHSDQNYWYLLSATAYDRGSLGTTSLTCSICLLAEW